MNKNIVPVVVTLYNSMMQLNCVKCVCYNGKKKKTKIEPLLGPVYTKRKKLSAQKALRSFFTVRRKFFKVRVNKASELPQTAKNFS